MNDSISLKDKLDEISFNYKLNKSKLNREINEHKKNECIKFRKNHKKLFLTFDIIIIILIIFNLGALLITNALVIKVEPDKEFMEANANAILNDGWKIHPESKIIMTQFQVFIFIWVFITFFYVLFRNRISKDEQLYFLLCYIILYGIGLTTDFINDLGYYIGVKLWGI